MKLTSLGQVIAERKLSLEGDETKEILVLLGSPRQFDDSPDYYCPYQIKGVGDEKIRYVGGVDGFQAVGFALQALGTELQVLNEKLNGKLLWGTQEKGVLGFPTEG